MRAHLNEMYKRSLINLFLLENFSSIRARRSYFKCGSYPCYKMLVPRRLIFVFLKPVYISELSNCFFINRTWQMWFDLDYKMTV